MSVRIFIVLYLLGMLTFTCVAEFGTPFWDRLWAFWQNIAYGSVLAWRSLYFRTKGEERLMVKPIYFYSVALLIWEFTALFSNLSIDNTAAVAIFFGIAAIIIGYIALWRDTRFSRFLIKYLRL